MSPNWTKLSTAFYGVALGSLAFSKAGIAIAGGLAFLCFLPQGLRQLQLYKTTFSFSLVGFAAALLLSAWMAPESANPWEKIDGMWPLGFLIVVPATIRLSKNPDSFLHVFLLLAGLGGLWSVLMAMGILPPHRDYPDLNIGPTHIMAFSVAMTTGLPLAFYACLREKNRRALWIIVSVLILCGLVSTTQRANVMTGCFLAAMTPLFHYRINRRTIMAVVALLAVIPLIALVGGGKLALLLEFDPHHLDTSNTNRLAHWIVAWDSFKSAPVFGHGLGSYSHLALNHPGQGEFLQKYIEQGQFTAHNYPLHVLATQGIVGLLANAWFGLSILLVFLRGFKTNRHAAYLGLMAWLILAATSVTDTPVFQSIRLGAFTLLTGYAYGLLRRTPATANCEYGFYQGGIHRFVREYIQKLTSLEGKRVLDIPCGTGRASYDFLQQEADVTPLDLFPQFMRVEELEAKYADLAEPLPVEDQSMDYIICEEGIEHVPNQIQVMQEFNRVLKDGGTLLLTTPNYSHIRCRISRFLFDVDYWKRVPPTEIDSIWFADEDSNKMYYGHLFLLDVQSLQSISTLTGFAVEQRVRTKISATSLLLGLPMYPLLGLMSLLSFAIYRRRNKHIDQATKDRILMDRVKLNLSVETLFCKQIFWVLKRERDLAGVAERLRQIQRYTPD
jgi:SAM-dependent methyltransferase